MVEGKPYKGKGNLKGNPQGAFEGFTRIWIVYDPNDPTNNATSFDLEIFKSPSSVESESSSFDWINPGLVIKALVVLIIGLFFKGILWLSKRIVNGTQGTKK